MTVLITITSRDNFTLHVFFTCFCEVNMISSSVATIIKPDTQQLVWKYLLMKETTCEPSK